MSDRRPRRIHHHNTTFLDHRGNQAIMSWHNHSAQDPGLPHLWCWAFYFTNPDFDLSLETFDGAHFKTGLFSSHPYATEYTRERFEFYHLPGGTPGDCVAHYRGEMEKRGTIWEDLERVERAQAGQAPCLKGLPGLVPAYASVDDMTCSYTGAVLMSEDADWDPEHKGRMVCRVEFDPLPQHFEPDEKIYFDPMEHPVYPTWLDAAYGVAAWIEDCRASQCPNEFLSTHGTNREAQSLGWSSW